MLFSTTHLSLTLPDILSHMLTFIVCVLAALYYCETVAICAWSIEGGGELLDEWCSIGMMHDVCGHGCPEGGGGWEGTTKEGVLPDTIRQ